jgi:hypothetical protein
MYKQQRAMELAERQAVEQLEQKKRDIVEEEKARLIAEHGHILKEYHPKASTHYGVGFN